MLINNIIHSLGSYKKIMQQEIEQFYTVLLVLFNSTFYVKLIKYMKLINLLNLQIKVSLILCIIKEIITYSYYSQLHAVSRAQQGRQRESSVMTLHSPLSAVFWGHCMLSGRTQRHALPRHHINLSKYFISSSGDRTHNQSILHFVLLRHDWPHYS